MLLDGCPITHLDRAVAVPLQDVWVALSVAVPLLVNDGWQRRRRRRVHHRRRGRRRARVADGASDLDSSDILRRSLGAEAACPARASLAVVARRGLLAEALAALEADVVRVNRRALGRAAALRAPRAPLVGALAPIDSVALPAPGAAQLDRLGRAEGAVPAVLVVAVRLEVVGIAPGRANLGAARDSGQVMPGHSRYKGGLRRILKLLAHFAAAARARVLLAVGRLPVTVASAGSRPSSDHVEKDQHRTHTRHHMRRARRTPCLLLEK
eukprot:scaffold21585_cov107-Isochrysis_galbana.AAC.1